MDGSFRTSPAVRVQGAVGLALLALILASGSSEAGGASETIQMSSTSESRAYALVRGNHSISTNMSLDEMLRLRRLYSGHFLWFRRGGRDYVIRDEALLLRAKALFDPLRSLDPERADLRRRERALDRKERILDDEEEELDRLADRFDDEDGEEEKSGMSESERRDLERRQRDLEERMRPVEEERREVRGDRTRRRGERGCPREEGRG